MNRELFQPLTPFFIVINDESHVRVHPEERVLYSPRWKGCIQYVITHIGFIYTT